MSPTERPLRWYAAAPTGTRLHVAVRWATCPFATLEALMPASGRILDWGCGHGLLALWLAQRGPGRTVHGVDLDPAKVAQAEAAAGATPFGGRLTFEVAEARLRPGGRWDGVVVNDVLYLQDEAEQRATIAAAAATLEPGGTLLIKEMAERPRWKQAATRAQEQVVVRGLRLTATAGGVHRPPSPDLLVEEMTAHGLMCSVVRLDRGYHCPHVAIIGRAPGGR